MILRPVYTQQILLVYHRVSPRCKSTTKNQHPTQNILLKYIEKSWGDFRFLIMSFSINYNKNMKFQL